MQLNPVLLILEKTINGRFFLNIVASLAEYERELIRERTNAGLRAAREKGKIGGRPKGFSKETVEKLSVVRSSYKDEEQTPEQIYNSLNISRATYYIYVKIIEQYTNDQIKAMQIK